MKTVNIGELKNQLSSYLHDVQNGEEIVVRDRNIPVARILPFKQDADWDRERMLVSSGTLKMPEQEMDWAAFYRTPAGNVSWEEAVKAAVESRGDR